MDTSLTKVLGAFQRGVDTGYHSPGGDGGAGESVNGAAVLADGQSIFRAHELAPESLALGVVGC